MPYKLFDLIERKEVSLSLYGEVLKESLQSYILENKLEKAFFLKSIKGNFDQSLPTSHFVILPSKRRLAKAVAEGMFWGCVPLATAVSCVALYARLW
jgi:hypothetical protein